MIDEKESTTTTKDNIILKLFSGRFILTIVAAIVFFQITDCICYILILKQSDISISDLLSIGNMLLMIISNIFTFYFTRERMSSVMSSKKDESGTSNSIEINKNN